MLDETAIRAFERPSDGRPFDETDVGLRAYVTRIPRRKLERYDPSWSDEEIREWDENFLEDGGLMLVCCERDVGVKEFREAVLEFLRFLSQAEPRHGPLPAARDGGVAAGLRHKP